MIQNNYNQNRYVNYFNNVFMCMRVFIMMTYLVHVICDFLSYSNIIHFMNLKWLKSLKLR